MKKTLILISVILFALTGCSSNKNPGVMVTSVSSDGKYAITTDQARRAILWNLTKHTYKILDTKANIYSAYFIKHTDDFMWQHDPNNEVTVENVNGKVRKKFNPGFATYGQVMTSNLKTYFATDEKWNLYKISSERKQIIKKSGFSSGFIGAGKLMNLVLSSNDQYLLTVGFADNDKPLSAGRETYPGKSWSRSLLDGAVLWNVRTGQPIVKYVGLTFKATGVISPRDRHVVTIDEQPNQFIWNLNGKKRIRAKDLIGGYTVCKTKKQVDCRAITTYLIPQPKSYGRRIDMLGGPYYKDATVKITGGLLGVKYVSKNDYLIFPDNSSWAVLYSGLNPTAIKYLNLGIKPPPSLVDYDHDQSFDSSWRAHILVTGQYYRSGIIVYKYDPKSQTLKKIWVGNIKRSWF